MNIALAILFWLMTGQQQLPYNSVDCDNANGNPKLCTVEADEPSSLPHGKLDRSNAIYFASDGTPYQCGPMSYYGALCWRPDGVPNAPKPPKGYMWELIREVPPKQAAEKDKSQ